MGRLPLHNCELDLTSQMCVLYLLSFLDRTNIGNARIAGLQDSFGSGGHQMSVGKFNAVLTIFFVSYSLAEPITNVLLKSLTPRRFIPIIMYLSLFPNSLLRADK